MQLFRRLVPAKMIYGCSTGARRLRRRELLVAASMVSGSSISGLWFQQNKTRLQHRSLSRPHLRQLLVVATVAARSSIVGLCSSGAGPMGGKLLAGSAAIPPLSPPERRQILLRKKGSAHGRGLPTCLAREGKGMERGDGGATEVCLVVVSR